MDYNVLDKKFISEKELYLFLSLVDKEFPISLSKKTNLIETAKKLYILGDIFCIKDNKNIIGLIAGYSNNTKDKTGYISVLAILNKYRGKGLASKLVNVFLDNAKKNGMNTVFLYTHASNVNAVKLYKRLGFYEVELKNNDDYVLEKVL
jgi:ribosomal protein S18 acetylase RimI-like enzyme